MRFAGEWELRISPPSLEFAADCSARGSLAQAWQIRLDHASASAFNAVIVGGAREVEGDAAVASGGLADGHGPWTAVYDA